MVPYIFQQNKLKDRFISAHPHLGHPLYDNVSDAFRDYVYACIETNEIVSIEFLDVDAVGFFGMPYFIEGFDQHSVQKSLMEDFPFPGHVFGVREGVLKFEMRNNWLKKDFDKLLSLTDLNDPELIMKESFLVACDILSRSPNELAIVCGPISSGSKSVGENLEVFNKTVFKVGQKMSLFNQMPFEPVFHVAHGIIKDDSRLCPNGNSSKFFIENFYEKLFHLPGRKWLPHFIDGYQESTGAMMEHQIFTKLGSKIQPLIPGFEKRFF